jgi:hypothetical protein
MKRSFLFFLFLMIPLTAFSNEVRVEFAKPVNFNSIMNPDFGSDVLVSPFEPIGPMAGIRAGNGTMYLAINDTLATSNLGLIIYQSTNLGDSWTLFPTGLTVRANYPRVKMLSVGDSVLCFFSVNGNIYRWNINSGFVAEFTINPGTDFDVVSSSTNSLYLFYITPANAIHRWGSADYGLTWSNTGSVSSGNNMVRLAMSATGDTLVLNYRISLQNPVQNSQVRSFRYRETAPATLAVTGSSIEVVSAGTYRNEYMSVFRGNILWFFYTEGQPGSQDLYMRVSTNNGAAFGSPIPVSNNPNRDEFFFGALYGSGASFNGADVFFVSDSSQAGPPTNQSDNMRYLGISYTDPSSPPPSTAISEHPPVWSDKGYLPAVIEIPGQSDVGVAWVGLDGTDKKVYWDRFDFISSVNNNISGIPNEFELSQNYPNPFNPVTKINFSIPKDGFVSLKVFDMLGREVATLVNGKISTGSYSIDFNGGRFPSGTYFYKLESEGFSDVKKMILIK